MTSGLCGTMDGDASNDFTTPNGTVLPQDQPWSVSSFAEAWRIPLVPSTTPVVDHAQQPWSWDPHTTNFNVNDPVDGQYTDESHVAAPTLAMTPAQETIVKTVCAAKLDNGTTADYVDCFYDYLQTLDPGFGLSSCVNRYGVGHAGVLCGSLVATTPSNSAVSGCLGDCRCSGRGECSNGTCLCFANWSGDACTVATCGTSGAGCPLHSTCDRGFCKCDRGWLGADCAVAATCSSVNNCTSTDQGTCVGVDVCECAPGFVGVDCAGPANCSTVGNCSSHGRCIGNNLCACDVGYTGDDCSGFSCLSLQRCSGHGTCSSFDSCSCDAGWEGASCAVPQCFGVNSCSGNGTCIDRDICR